MLMIKLPANEIIWEKISDSYGNPLYCITSDRRRDVYYLYSVNRKGETARIGKGKDPPELYKKYINKLRRA